MVFGLHCSVCCQVWWGGQQRRDQFHVNCGCMSMGVCIRVGMVDGYQHTYLGRGIQLAAVLGFPFPVIVSSLGGNLSRPLPHHRMATALGTPQMHGVLDLLRFRSALITSVAVLTLNVTSPTLGTVSIPHPPRTS